MFLNTKKDVADLFVQIFIDDQSILQSMISNL